MNVCVHNFCMLHLQMQYFYYVWMYVPEKNHLWVFRALELDFIYCNAGHD
jgi:hypothetical protein